MTKNVGHGKTKKKRCTEVADSGGDSGADSRADSGGCISREVVYFIAAGITKSEVSRLVAKYRETGNVKDVPRSGRPKPTIEGQDRLIIQHSRKNHFKTARQFRDDLQGEIGIYTDGPAAEQ